MLNWTNIKVNIPGVGERAYVVHLINPPPPFGNSFDGNGCEANLHSGCYLLGTGFNGQGTNTLNPAYNTTNPLTGGLFTLLPTYPVVGDYISLGFVAGAGSNPTAINSRTCLKVVAVISEAEYLNGWCNACDVNSTFCPDPPGCSYSFGTFTSGVGPLAYHYINTNLALEYNGYTNDIRIDSNCVDCHSLPVTSNAAGSDCDDCDELVLIDAGMSGSVSYNGAFYTPTSVIGVPTSVVGLTDCGWRGFNAHGSSCGSCAYSGSTSIVTPSNYIDLHVWFDWMSINHPSYNKGPGVGNTIPLATFLTNVMVLPMSGYTPAPPACCGNNVFQDFNGSGPCGCSYSCCPGQNTPIKTSWIGQPFILTERYALGTSVLGNTLVSGSWSTVLSWLWANGMPNTIFTYAAARPWYTDLTNLTGVLAIWNIPGASLTNSTGCCVKYSPNDVSMTWSNLAGKCDQPIPGCTDNFTPALNYNSLATVNCDGTPIGTFAAGWSACCTYVTTACGYPVCWECNGSSCYTDPQGIYSSQTQCLTGLPPVPFNPYPQGCDPCSCIPIPGTGHTGTYHYTNQTLCELICCNGYNIKRCDVLIIGPGDGILYYDLTTNTSVHLFDDTGAESIDISATVTDIWTIKNTTGGGNIINNHTITTNPFTQAPSGSILAAGNVMGKGLCFYNQNNHLTATDWVKVVNNTSGVPTNWFQLPNNMKCTGDILWGGTINPTLVILMSGMPTGGLFTHKVAKFTQSGTLIQDYVIPSTILTGTTSFDSLFVNNVDDEIYGITTDARVYHLQQSPTFQFAPLPTAFIPRPNDGEIRGATNIEYDLWGENTCATTAIKIPKTFNCSLTAMMCQDPGDGTGQFTGPNGYANCQAACVFSYNCDPGTGMGNCAGVTIQLPFPLVNNSMIALYYFVDPTFGINTNPFDACTYENSSPVPNGCQNNGNQTWRLKTIFCAQLWSTPFYYWQQFINNCVGIHGIPVNMSMNLVTVRNAINNHFGYVVPIVINSEPCICYGSPCHCDAVIGATTGTYPDNWSCVQNCCGAVPCVKCCKHNITQNVYQLPSWLYPCDCPAGHYEVPCGIIQPPSPITSALDFDPQSKCKIGQMFSYELNRCVCQRPYPCAEGNIWDEAICKCIPAYATNVETVIQIKQSIVKDDKKKEKEKTVVDGVTVEDTYGTTVTDTVQYYRCADATNSTVGERQRACIPQDSNTPGSYHSLEDCLNSGCAGFMKCEPGQSVNGVIIEGEAFYTPIVMCCEKLISTQLTTGPYEYTVSGPLTVANCSSSCGDGQTWFPLYNATGPNTVHESELAYMIRELELQVAIHQCSVTTDEERWISAGYIKKNIY